MKLSHFSDSKNEESIKENGVLNSMHTPPKRSMWLGSGSYFYKTDCQSGKKEAFSLIKNKGEYSKKGISEFQFEVNIDDDLILSLNNSEHINRILEIVENIAEEMSKKTGAGSGFLKSTLKEFRIALENIEEFLPFSNDNYGHLLGNYINLLRARNEINFDIVECEFNSVPNRYFERAYEHAIIQLGTSKGKVRTPVYQCCINYSDSNYVANHKRLISHAD